MTPSNHDRRLCTVKNVPTKYPEANITEAGLRWLRILAIMNT